MFLVELVVKTDMTNRLKGEYSMIDDCSNSTIEYSYCHQMILVKNDRPGDDGTLQSV